ncbi:MAG: prepilin-type N-terminal cleavage/methylation domain-containing protein [Deltaproteobacteria bacterium]|nr:prepilin-type N-terminal cleavage/methylation domain-containing protein [Deltaproteobacteria bacterium]
MSEDRRQNRASRVRPPHARSQKPVCDEPFGPELMTEGLTAEGTCRVEAGSPGRAAGFTLMEILIAIAILAIVVTTALASFNAVFSTTEVLDDGAHLYEMANTSMKRIALDLAAMHINQRPLYKPPEFDQPPDPYRLIASADETGGTGFAKNIRFTSRAHLPFEKSDGKGIVEIVYYFQTTNDGYLELRRADNAYPFPEFEKKASDPILCKYVKSLSFKFYDTDGIEFDVWDSDSDEFGYATPTAIAVKLELAKNAEVHTFETMVSLPLIRERAE